MARTDRAPSMSVQTCANGAGCGYILPPARSWTDFHTAEHDWTHLLWEIERRAAHGVTRPDATGTLHLAAVAYIDALRAREKTIRRTITDPLHDQIADLEFELYDARHRIQVLEAELDEAKQGAHQCP